MINRIKTELENSIVPLCLPKSSTQIKQQGSSLYFKYNDNYYLSTAYHVLFEDDNNTIFIGDNFIYPTGTEFINLPNFHLASAQKKDICILILEEPLKNFTPYEMNNNFYTDSFVQYCCAGYPGTKTKQYKTTASSDLRFFYTTRETKKAFIKHLQPFEIPLRFVKSKCMRMDKTPIIFPIPEGMSGGPLIAYDDHNYIIYGILTRWNDKLQRTMYATFFDYLYLLNHL